MLYAAAVKVKIQVKIDPPVAQLPEPTNGLHPAEALLEEFPLLLTDRISEVPRRTPIDGISSPWPVVMSAGRCRNRVD